VAVSVGFPQAVTKEPTRGMTREYTELVLRIFVLLVAMVGVGLASPLPVPPSASPAPLTVA
jgi:O-antigen/teichoic acid export membrane protein